MLRLKVFRDQAKGLPDLLNWAALIADGVVLGKDGSLLAAWAYRGQDLASATPEALAAVSARVNGALVRLGSGWMAHIDCTREPARGYPEPSASFFPDAITQRIDEERRQQFQAEGGHYESYYVLTLTYLPPLMRHSKLADAMFDDDSPDPPASLSTKLLRQFEERLEEIEGILSASLKLRRLRGQAFTDIHGQHQVRDHLLEHLNTCLTGRRHPMLLPPCPMYLDAILGGHELWAGVTPRLEENYISVIGIDGFPHASFPGILNLLDQLPICHRWSTRFIALDPTDAVARLKVFRRKWQQKVRGFADQFFKTNSGVVDQDALHMVSETDEAVAEANSQHVAYGYYTCAVVLMHPSREGLDEHAAQVRQAIQNKGFNARIETINCMEAWLGSLPGHALPNLRRPLLHTLNLADLVPLASIWPGRETNPCPFYRPGAPPLLHAATEGATPYRLNLHVGDVGHTLIFGPTGAGKSTLLALLAAQFRRYPDATLFAFDKLHSLLPLTWAAGGAHYDIGADGQDLQFCPLAQINSDTDAAWAETWLGQLLSLQGLEVSARQRSIIHDAIALLRQAPPANRSLSDLAFNVQDMGIREALGPYTVDGTMGHLLDGVSDSLAESTFMTFEIEELMRMGEVYSLPVLLYLFHTIERRLRGQPALLLLDEAWLMLGHPVFREKIREWLKVLRKANCAVVLATQSLSDAARSGIVDVLVESCPTKIFLPNVDATKEASRPLYEDLGLNERQIDIIAGAAYKRHYYVTSPEGNRLIDLNLGPVALSFVGASSKEEVARIRTLAASHGADWPEPWLQERGLHVGV